MTENLFEALNDNEKGVLLSAAMQFKNVIVELFGEDYAEDAFNNIADSVLPNLKYEMLKNALTNKYSLIVTILSAPGRKPDQMSQYEKVKAVKTIREYSDVKLGLKEAVDICNFAETGHKTNIKVSSIENRAILIRELTLAGMKVC